MKCLVCKEKKCLKQFCKTIIDTYGYFEKGELFLSEAGKKKIPTIIPERVFKTKKEKTTPEGLNEFEKKIWLRLN